MNFWPDKILSVYELTIRIRRLPIVLLTGSNIFMTFAACFWRTLM
jgi:uncharacterized protein (DUF486 family)